jgi:hypothetical protein
MILIADHVEIRGDLVGSLVLQGVSDPERTVELIRHYQRRDTNDSLLDCARATLAGLRSRLRHGGQTIGSISLEANVRPSYVRAQASIRPILYAAMRIDPSLMADLAAFEHCLGATMLVGDGEAENGLPSITQLFRASKELAFGANDVVLASNSTHHVAMAASVGRDLPSACNQYVSALDLLDSSALPSVGLRSAVHYDLAESLGRLGEIQAARRHLDLAGQYASDADDPNRMLHVIHNRALVQLFAGNFAGACEEFLGIEPRVSHDPFLQCSCAKYGAFAAFCAGEFQAWEGALSRSKQLAERHRFFLHTADLKKFLRRLDRYHQIRRWKRAA